MKLKIQAKIIKKEGNQAEYLAMLNALKENKGEIEILSGSMFVVNQLNRKWHIKMIS